MTPLSSKRLFLFDIDGTIAVGDTLYPGTRDLLDYIRSVGGAAYYITNNSTRSNGDYVKKFREVFDLETNESQFVTSGYMTLRHLQEHHSGDKIYVLGTASYIAELRKNGLHVTEEAQEDAACAVVAYDSELTYEKLVKACRLLSLTDIPFYGTNPDLCCPIDFGFIPDCGSICQMITASTGKAPGGGPLSGRQRIYGRTDPGGGRPALHGYRLRTERRGGHLCPLHRRGHPRRGGPHPI